MGELECGEAAEASFSRVGYLAYPTIEELTECTCDGVALDVELIAESGEVAYYSALGDRWREEGLDAEEFDGRLEFLARIGLRDDALDAYSVTAPTST